ncbi:MAG: serine/threonine protein kinase [Lachnospiraceae bacterium]|nr:serine/threonine protein kinase [Lachnospiraceae bacterium]
MNNMLYDTQPTTDYSDRLEFSYYETISAINEARHIYLVRHRSTGMICVRKDLGIYNISIYRYLKNNPINGTPKIYALYESDGILTVIEEFIPGETLANRLEHNPFIDEKECRQVLLSICDILSQLHNAVPPIVHRDIKPSNIMLTADGLVKVLDFNAAKYSDNTQESDTTLLGTCGYAAPEQYGFGSSSPRTDIYALGMLIKHMIDINPHLASVFSKVAEKCTRIDPDDRYQNIASLRSALTSHSNPLPPGFRQKKLWHMLIAIPIYIFIFWLSLTVEYSNLPPSAQPVERLFTLIWLLGMVGITCNYQNIWTHLPLCNSPHMPLKIPGIILWNAIYTMITIIIIVIIDITIFNYHG